MMDTLYEKYRVTDYKELPALNPLSFILRKAELSLNLKISEWVWLEQHQLVETIDIIKNQENYRISLHREVRRELMQLKKNEFLSYSMNTIPVVDSEIAFILYRIHTQERLAESELCFVNQSYHFNQRKQKYGITENISCDGIAENIFSKLENNTPFYTADIQWLRTHNAYSFLIPLKNQFSQLQAKYKANIYDKLDIDLLFLFYILQKLDENKRLEFPEIEYLKTLDLIETLEISQKIEFSALKKQYQATQIQDDAINSHLYKVLKKLEAGSALPEPDINYLKKRKLFETLKFVYKKQTDSLIHKIKQGHELRPDDIRWCEEHDFEDIILQWLKKDYAVEHRQDKPESPLYPILKKLKIGKRLTDDEVVWLESEKWLIKNERYERLPYSSSKVFIAHHTLEAQFNESEFQRTKDYWKLVNASAHWRKAEAPAFALQQTTDLDFKHIKPAKLRGALLTTRGGAFRDIDRLNEAEQCALEAIKHFPDSHHPYTLLGALCYDTGRYPEGDRWFEEAVERGATLRDQDAEIKRILPKKKGDELKKLIDHLLKKDPIRFSWVNKYKKS